MRAALLLAALALAPAGCAEEGGRADAAPGAEARSASVTGTVVDADTRAPVAGASVAAPGGARAKTDARGRFRLDGLAPGLSGELVASGPEGGEARLPLRPLRTGTLEVVLHLRRP